MQRFLTPGNGGRKLLIQAAMAVLLTSLSSPAWSAMVTLHEAAVESIFAQSGFADPIDLRFGPTIEYVAPALLDLSSEAEFNILRNEFFGLPNTTVRLFFIDSLSWCGSAGCANGSIAVVNSSDAANTSYGDELIAHELAHVLGLRHPDAVEIANDPELDSETIKANLMNPTVVDGRMTLTALQIEVLLDDFNVLEDSNGKPYVDIAPVLVVAAATAVPLPGAALLMLGALLPLGAARRRA